MPCFSPIGAYQDGSGKPLSFGRGSADGKPLPFDVYVACGQCIGCRRERVRQWASRIVNESKLHAENGFLTLTYDDTHLPVHGNLVYRDFQLFLKRYRKMVAPVKLRFFMCGEYGSRTGRPHFHAAIFGHWFSDSYVFKRGRYPLYRSPALESLWVAGSSCFGALTFDSAAYVAGYIYDKMNGEKAAEHYRRVDLSTGEMFSLTPEFSHMSLKPGIGHDWLVKYAADYANSGTVVVNGFEAKPPKYYDRKLKSWDMFPDEVEFRRYLAARKRIAESFPGRLAVREKVAKAALSLKNREI